MNLTPTDKSIFLGCPGFRVSLRTRVHFSVAQGFVCPEEDRHQALSLQTFLVRLAKFLRMMYLSARVLREMVLLAIGLGKGHNYIRVSNTIRGGIERNEWKNEGGPQS